MPTSVALSPYFEKFIHEQVQSGRYNNASEVVRSALRLLEDAERDKQVALHSLRAAVEAGIASEAAGQSLDAQEVFTRLKDKYQSA